MTLEEALASAKTRCETTLNELLPQGGEAGEAVLAAAMRHAALGGGKRLRAFLVMETAALFGAPETCADRAAAAVECLHAYSLVHDDLPAMDDDDMRRGRPTVHVAWDEATGILAGDALQTIAFEILADRPTSADAAIRAELVLTLAKAAGQAGMAGGQMLDIAAEDREETPSLEEVERLQSLKTGALFEWCAEAGAILGRAGEMDRARLRSFACDLGSAFQIQDDILDVEGDEAATGKPLRKDHEAGKATYVDLLGLDGARAKAEALVRRATITLSPFGQKAALLSEAAQYAISRAG